MKKDSIQFNNGATYERYMGVWSRLTGQVFLDWLQPASGLRWLDVGCGNGAFTEMIVERCTPGGIQGIDPSAEQLAYASSRSTLKGVEFHQADAQSLPFSENKFDVAVMPLVIFFVPNPAKGVQEMTRVVGSGGLIAAYAWDMGGGGFPYHLLHSEMRRLGMDIPVPPSSEASRIDIMQTLWQMAGLEFVETRQIEVTRTFIDFEDYWHAAQGAPSVGPKLAVMPQGELEALKTSIRQSMPVDVHGHMTFTARANAVKGYAPKKG